MADAWTTVVDREPEWDDYSRSEAIALEITEQSRCKQCGQTGQLVEVRKATRYWNWGDGRRYLVRIYRCLGCAATETVQRDYSKQHEDHKYQAGIFDPRDGIRVHTTLEREVIDRGHTS